MFKQLIETRNQELSLVVEFSCNQGTSINNHLQHKKERPRRKNLQVFPLETLKNCDLNEKFHP